MAREIKLIISLSLTTENKNVRTKPILLIVSSKVITWIIFTYSLFVSFKSFVLFSR